ncbi:MAG: DUF5698 domain-containing protein [Oscillospiraceae bacterium]|nr:DUF5698 domain-containing protein [Oscillospiraceae bacterium]
MWGITGVWVYVIIFLGKVVEVSFDTLKIVFVGKGKKLLGTACGLISITIWLILVSNVINDIYSDPMKGVIYCLGFAAGVYVGTLIDEWLAVGLTSMQVVLDDQRAEQLGCALREQGYGVTILEGHSVGAAKRGVLLVQLKRRSIPAARRLIFEKCPEAVISVNDLRSLEGGYLKRH